MKTKNIVLLIVISHFTFTQPTVVEKQKRLITTVMKHIPLKISLK